MKIAVIGAGFTGLSLGYYLGKKGYKITVFEKSRHLGGLASGIKVGKWYVDRFYRHIFSSDLDAQKLAEDVGFDKWIWRSTDNTFTYYQKEIYPFSGPFDLLTFDALPFIDRVRTGFFSLYLKVKKSPFGLEEVNASKWLQQYMGKKSYQVIWQPLLQKKFGFAYQSIIMAWLWARLYKRTTSLGYPEGGFEVFANAIGDAIIKQGGRIQVNKKITSLNSLFPQFDKIIYTGPSYNLPDFIKLPLAYKKTCRAKQGLSALTLVLEYAGSILPGKYWININTFKPEGLVCVVNHSAMAGKANYDNHQVIYMGGYFMPNDKFLNLKKSGIMKKWLPFLFQLDPDFDKVKITNSQLFVEANSQPIFKNGYKKNILPFRTPIKNLYIVNMDQIYPWDRGINYAVAKGKEFLQDQKW
jgi:protoporphyrinogen oxidase